MECQNDKCELRQRIQEVTDGVRVFQHEMRESMQEFQREMKNAFSDLDARQTDARKDSEQHLREEMQRERMTVTARIDRTIEDNNKHLLQINSDLGEIKGALGLKTDKDETGQLRTSVMNRMEAMKSAAREEAQREIDRIRGDQTQFKNKVLFTIIGLLGSGLFFALGHFL